ncbi:single-stranded-DNA-specific exonuclease RecJ [Desertibaculum subflavum]|uniref:single-stranded-DNA-specific exonuclease RecJ n=1 Tax=Desertibaculum subflavum TaxID=2268458 RepID=UPI000E669FBD
MSGAPAFLGVERSLTERRWEARAADARHAAAIAQSLNVPELIGRVLAGRGVVPDEAPRWLDPKLRDWLPDPSRLRDMDAAAARLADAVQMGERVALLGDYDVDGATSSAVLIRFLRSYGAEPLVHIPDRMKEGYGPNAAALRALKERGAGLVLTLDCGTLAHEPLAEARRIGLDAIVVDHHLAEPELPPAVAVVNPNRLDESGGLGQLAAVGCAFLLAVATARTLRERGVAGDPALLDLLDLVALGTVCDVVPMTGVNRAFAGQGLKVLARRRNAGLAALIDAAGISTAPTAYHLGYLLGPRVNAGGRVGRSDLGTRLLSTDDPAEAAALAAELSRLNQSRREIEAEVEAAALAQALASEAPLIVAAGEGWHAGVVGIVAGRLKERFRRPAIVIGLEGGIGKGSGRSIPGIDLGAAVVAAKQSGLLLNGGGHPMAAGLTVAADRVADLAAFLHERLAAQVTARTDRNVLQLDGAVAVGGANAALATLIEQAGPYGPGNAIPRLAIADARIGWRDVVGERHVRVSLTAPGGAKLKAIAFRAVDTALGRALLKGDGAPLHLAGTLGLNHWRGEAEAQLVIDDAAPVAGAVPA